MLSVAQVLEVRRLLDEGMLSQREVAEKAGVSRGTVRNVATGRRGLDELEPASQVTPFELETETRLPERCIGCGGLVYMPCRLCRARKAHRSAEIVRQWLREVRSTAPPGRKGGRRVA